MQDTTIRVDSVRKVWSGKAYEVTTSDGQKLYAWADKWPNGVPTGEVDCVLFTKGSSTYVGTPNRRSAPRRESRPEAQDNRDNKITAAVIFKGATELVAAKIASGGGEDVKIANVENDVLDYARMLQAALGKIERDLENPPGFRGTMSDDDDLDGEDLPFDDD